MVLWFKLFAALIMFWPRWPRQEIQETQVQSLGKDDPLSEEMATHSNILA